MTDASKSEDQRTFRQWYRDICEYPYRATSDRSEVALEYARKYGGEQTDEIEVFDDSSFSNAVAARKYQLEHDWS